MLVALVALAGLPAASRADEDPGGLALARARQCLACHQIDEKRVGPPFASIRTRFRGDLAAVPYLAQSIRQGGRGRWGVIPMPSQPHVSPAEAEQLARWILRLEPENTP